MIFTTTELEKKEYCRKCAEEDKIPLQFIECKCCLDHKKNFPTLGSKLPKFYGNAFKLQKDCNCNCRHLAREICRQWDILHEVDDISSDEYSTDYDSSGSLKDFIVKDSGFLKKQRKKLDKALDKFRGKKHLRR